MTKEDLIREVALNTGLSVVDVKSVIETSIQRVMHNVSKGESLFIRGFGTLSVKVRKAKMARNITKGTSVMVPEHKVPYFKPAADFKAKVN